MLTAATAMSVVDHTPETSENEQVFQIACDTTANGLPSLKGPETVVLAGAAVGCSRIKGRSATLFRLHANQRPLCRDRYCDS